MSRRTRSKNAMRDLLYVSESKMRVLAPQLPDRVRNRLGIEAGINTGIVAVKGTLASRDGNTPSSIEALDAVVEMIERSHGERSHTDADLRPGDWIKLNETFEYGQADDHQEEFTGPDCLVYFAATTLPPLVLLTSAKHILEVQQENSAPEQRRSPGPFYLDLFRDQYRALLETPGEGAEGVVEDVVEYMLFYAVWQLCDFAARRAASDRGQPARLAGHARVLAVGQYGPHRPRCVVATPLYLEYAPR
ncbi:SAVMC3_10250 family protein [Streptomyces sp. NPDC005859]|uniref:SAVMC3_10250 family protein n=1 Tax=Streptomyces sp. NPDC005859 TaxID=3157170 RepID=UPI0033DDB9BC